MDPTKPIRKIDLELIRYRYWLRKRNHRWRIYLTAPERKSIYTVSFRLNAVEKNVFDRVCSHYRIHQRLKRSEVLRALILQEAEALGLWQRDENPKLS